MMIIDETLPKVQAEVRLDKDNNTLWIKTEAWNKADRIILEDGKTFCMVFYAEQADRKTEPSGYCNECKWYGDKQVCGRCRSRNLYAPKTEPTISKMEQVDEPTADNLSPVEDKPQTEEWHYDEKDNTWYPYQHKSCATCKHALGNWDGESNNCGRCCGAGRRFYEPKTEPTGYNLSPVDKDINVRSNSSEKPNNLSEKPTGSTISKMEQVEDEPQIIACPLINDDAWIYEDKPTGYNLSPVDNDINVRSKDETRKSCSTCGYSTLTPSGDTCEGYSNWWSLEDEQTERSE